MDSSFVLPGGLEWLKESAAGRHWLAALPDLVATCAEQWGVDIGDPYEGSFTSLAIRVKREGRPLVLKVQFPDRESEHEADALRLWAGGGAVVLVEHDPTRRALLLERCDPGFHLSTTDPDTALGVLTNLLPRLWQPASASTFTRLVDETARWTLRLPQQWERAGRPFPRRLVDVAVEALTWLAPSQGDQVLLHQDLHPDNVLAANREPWLAIDPKPLVGEREFGAAPIIRAPELGHGREVVLGRLDRVTSELALDRERTRLWTVGQTLAWAFENNRALPHHVDVVRWLQGH